MLPQSDRHWRYCEDIAFDLSKHFVRHASEQNTLQPALPPRADTEEIRQQLTDSWLDCLKGRTLLDQEKVRQFAEDVVA